MMKILNKAILLSLTIVVFVFAFLMKNSHAYKYVVDSEQGILFYSFSAADEENIDFDPSRVYELINQSYSMTCKDVRKILKDPRQRRGLLYRICYRKDLPFALYYVQTYDFDGWRRYRIIKKTNRGLVLVGLRVFSEFEDFDLVE